MKRSMPAERPRRRRGLKRAVVLVLVILGLALLALPRFRDLPAIVGRASPAVPEAPKPALDNLPANPLPAAEPQNTNSTDTSQPMATLMAAAPLIPDRSLNPSPVAAAKAPAPDQSSKVPEVPPAPVVNGTLAVSSATSTDIFINDRYMGSAPASLDLPPGTYAVEYRHGTLSKRQTHVIKDGETTRAVATFDVAVSINANPWANVFLDGLERRPLGQTPLSGVVVPIGGVLVFENPKFQGKRYRVTGNETGIQILFP